MINEFKELLPAIITILPIMWAFRSISKETADRYIAVTKECAAIQKECKEDYKELNEKHYKLEEKIYKLMLERGMK